MFNLKIKLTVIIVFCATMDASGGCSHFTCIFNLVIYQNIPWNHHNELKYLFVWSTQLNQYLSSV